MAPPTCVDACATTPRRPCCVFNEWSEVFPNATSIIALIDRLCLCADVAAATSRAFGHTTQRSAAVVAALKPD
jgi:hypothetical protein